MYIILLCNVNLRLLIKYPVLSILLNAIISINMASCQVVLAAAFCMMQCEADADEIIYINVYTTHLNNHWENKLIHRIDSPVHILCKRT